MIHELCQIREPNHCRHSSNGSPTSSRAGNGEGTASGGQWPRAFSLSGDGGLPRTNSFNNVGTVQILKPDFGGIPLGDTMERLLLQFGEYVVPGREKELQECLCQFRARPIGREKEKGFEQDRRFEGLDN